MNYGGRRRCELVGGPQDGKFMADPGTRFLRVPIRTNPAPSYVRGEDAVKTSQIVFHRYERDGSSRIFEYKGESL